MKFQENSRSSRFSRSPKNHANISDKLNFFLFAVEQQTATLFVRDSVHPTGVVGSIEDPAPQVDVRDDIFAEGAL